IHSDLLKTRTMRDFADMYPERFGNQTNGVTPRRWLLNCNPDLSRLITETIGEGWVTNLAELHRLRPLAEDAGFREQFRWAKRRAKTRFTDWLRAQGGPEIDPNTIFDSQIKRIHEYKRQLLNALHCVVLYNRLRHNPALTVPPRTVFFAGKAAPAYTLAKLIIKLINNIAAVVDHDPAIRGRLKVVFLPNYSVSLAERLIPASDLSEQISTAGYEASGTGNMKFMMNGALTIGTLDGANVEIRDAVGPDHFFLFGMTAEEVLIRRAGYRPWDELAADAELARVIDQIASGEFSPGDRALFAPLIDDLVHRDPFLVLADFRAYADCQRRVEDRWRQPASWLRSSILNTARSGQFSSDRAIREYARTIWNVQPVPSRTVR
ncbi:MAG TPA: glycogen/starch/alpha-glucan phosphorylase, partial [Kofleriaceae bacterium]